MFGFFEPIHLNRQKRKKKKRKTDRHLRKTTIIFNTEHSLVFPKLRSLNSAENRGLT